MAAFSSEINIKVNVLDEELKKLERRLEALDKAFKGSAASGQGSTRSRQTAADKQEKKLIDDKIKAATRLEQIERRIFEARRTNLSKTRSGRVDSLERLTKDSDVKKDVRGLNDINAELNRILQTQRKIDRTKSFVNKSKATVSDINKEIFLTNSNR